MGRLDVDAMLDEIGHAQFVEWVALGVVDGWADDWERAGTIAAAAHNAGVLSVSAHAQVDIAKLSRTPDQYIPGMCRQGGPPRRRLMTAAESEAAARARSERR